MSRFDTWQKDYPRAAEMLLEIRERIPWQRDITGSLVHFVEKKGKLSDKQMSLISSLYADNCMYSDEDIKAQRECRKLCIRLLYTRLGKMGDFIQSVLRSSETFPFTPRQMKAVRNIANRKRKELENVPNLTANNFDGWYQIGIVGVSLPDDFTP